MPIHPLTNGRIGGEKTRHVQSSFIEMDVTL